MHQKKTFSGFTLTELLVAAGMLAGLCAFALTMLTQAVRQAEQIRVLIYTVHDAQRENPLSESKPLNYEGRVGLECQRTEVQKSFFVQTRLECKGPRRDVQYSKSFLRPEFQWQNQI